MNNNYIGENIKIYRERQNLTQQQLADKIGKTWEMISRYERGVSSPLNQLESLAKALNTSPSDLLNDITDGNIRMNFSRVPLFTTIPSSFVFNKSNTFLFYNSPDWVLSIDPEAFALDMGVIDNSKGIIYVSPNSEIYLNDLVLIKEENGLRIESVKTFKGIDILGKVLAKEVRY
ncbi:helix-turn-helix domain-containing protein [Patescibacteria group bacterium]|nr:helix-turn-helix domain-containing protein [Patescibacteria group bacterium]